ncbi:hypothetical protein NQ317_004955 [Molorchus minor]|uniref:Protein ARV n=1 Tax=Molorchus minor TaxID=1323400 RepID=A0ABQ9K2A5_9CUCU|nr:hypothetical protein NQ317_004955 [Molorchus minor]
MDKSEEKREYTCIECGGSVKNLYKKYSETVLKLTRCDACNKIADKYVEYDPVIIIIDLILLRVMAYRHFLLNTEIKNFWKLSIILLLLETYLNWTLVTKGTLLKQEMNDTKPDLTESDVSLDDFKFYKLFLTTTINTFCFVLTIYLCTVFYTLFGNRKRISFVTAGKTVTLSSTGLFLFLPSLIWDLSVHDFHLHFVSLYTTLSQLVAYKGNTYFMWLRKTMDVIRDLFVDFMQDLSRRLSKYLSVIEEIIPTYFEINHFIFSKEKDAAQRALTSDMGHGPQNIKKSTKETSNFKETVGNMSQVRFRKHYQRRAKLTEAEVATIQDCKDVALFTCNASLLSPEFIKYFHTKAMDDFLRALVVYFQYYFQIWNKMQVRRKEAARKLRQPIVTELENVVRDNLSDLRSMVSRNFAIMLLGYGDAKPYHHMANKNKESLSDKDRRLFETLMILTTRVIWIALFRKYLTLIEKEMNRLLRTNIFSPYEHKVIKTTTFDALPEEERVLVGKAYSNERKLLHRSPVTQELILDSHDYKIFAIGVTGTEQSDPRQAYLEAAYTAPEDMLEELGVPVGVLGVPRKYLDAMLKPKEVVSTRRRQSTMKPIQEFVLPPKVPYEEMKITETLPKQPVKYEETASTAESRKKQCKKWRKYVERGGITISSSQQARDKSVSLTPPSYTTLQNSATPINSRAGAEGNTESQNQQDS